MIKIDVDTRIWEIPEEEKFIGVESDGSVKKYKFELSKNEFYEGLNFTDCNCYINYKNEDNDAIPYGITDMAVQDDGKVTFTWEVSRGATIFQGNTFAVLCVKKVREDGTITNEWNSRIGAFIVNKGIEPKDSIAELPEIDIISQLLNTAQYVNQIAQQNITKSEELIQTAQELLEKNDFYKGYIVDGETYSGKASNSGIKLHKVIGKTEQGTTKGYQLFDASKLPTKSAGGATVTNHGDGSFTISGSGNLSASFYMTHYYTHEESLKLVKSGAIYGKFLNISYPYATFRFLKGDERIAELDNYDGAIKQSQITDEMLAYDDFRVQIYFNGTLGKPIVPGTIKPMIYQDGDGTWEQYTGRQPAPNPDYPMPIENVEISEINSFNKNLSPKNTIEDITWAINDNQLVESVNKLPIGKYYVSMKFTLTEKTEDFSIENTLYGILFNSNGYQGKQIRWGTDVIGTIKEVEFVLEITSNNVGKFINVWLYGAGSTGKPRSGKAKITELQIEKGETKTEFVESKFATVETSLTLAEGEVYEEGQPILRKRKKAVFDGSIDEAWEKEISANRYIIKVPNSNASYVRGECKCNRGRFYYERVEPGVTFMYGGYLYYYPPTDINTLELFKEWLTTHNLEVEYPLNSPTTEELKVPTIPSYNPHTNVWTDNTLSTDMQWKILADSDRSLEVEANEKRIAALEKQLIGG